MIAGFVLVDVGAPTGWGARRVRAVTAHGRVVQTSISAAELARDGGAQILTGLVPTLDAPEISYR